MHHLIKWLIKYQIRLRGQNPQGPPELEVTGLLGVRCQEAVRTAALDSGPGARQWLISGNSGLVWPGFPVGHEKPEIYCVVCLFFPRNCRNAVRSNGIDFRDVLASGCQSATVSVTGSEPWQIRHGEGRSSERGRGPRLPHVPTQMAGPEGPQAQKWANPG